ncbi:hypothetical protein TSAR_005162 [Trichomalopsis sarcophagae]|uniref:Uncharacterized protein n=1 Tax=Trichomalopsis sarcophagae TaxID=543379 RepID=A0A232EG57_9HYME|nr:hypothetical protein TSAR_005162 [Trichomalopsis sarcophagae]
MTLPICANTEKTGHFRGPTRQTFLGSLGHIEPEKPWFKFPYENLTWGKLSKTSHDSTLPTQCMKVQFKNDRKVSEESFNLRAGELKMAA